LRYFGPVCFKTEYLSLPFDSLVTGSMDFIKEFRLLPQ